MDKVDLSPLTSMSGFLGACLVDSKSTMILGIEDNHSPIDLKLAATGNIEVVRAKRKMLKENDLKGKVEDALITLLDQYHIIRPLSGVNDGIFLFVILHRATANLGMARHTLRDYEKTLGDLSI